MVSKNSEKLTSFYLKPSFRLLQTKKKTKGYFSSKHKPNVTEKIKPSSSDLILSKSYQSIFI